METSTAGSSSMCSSPPIAGRATEAALRSVASSLDLPRRSVHLLRGATTRRKLLEIEVAPAETDRLRRQQMDCA